MGVVCVLEGEGVWGWGALQGGSCFNRRSAVVTFSALSSVVDKVFAALNLSANIINKASQDIPSTDKINYVKV